MHNVTVSSSSLKSSRVWLRYEEKIIPNKLNHKQLGVCKENKEKELEENKRQPVKIFCS